VKIRFRIFLGFVVIIAAGFYFLTTWTLDDVRPQTMKATEETLVDLANILAAQIEARLAGGRLPLEDLQASLELALARRLDVQIYELRKSALNIRVYVTDDRGIVLFDTARPGEVGRDYSRWNDVYLTLQGRYGVRATRTDPEDMLSTVLYVAAPIRQRDRIVGVLTVAKPVESIKLFITQASRKIALGGTVAFCLALLLSWGIASWITAPVRKLANYAQAVRDGQRVVLPGLGGGEIGLLGKSFEEMRDALEGKNYIEQYVQSLTHEIKTPLASIRAAAELLEEEPPADSRRRFLDNIRSETRRIQLLIERLLRLASLEGKKVLDRREPLSLREVVREVIGEMAPAAAQSRVALVEEGGGEGRVRGDRLLLVQAVGNLVQNAVQFTPPGGRVTVELREGAETLLVVRDTGPGVPEYALGRVFERFYSLPRPGTGKKSTGLGLPFVRQVALLHGAAARLENDPAGGSVATLRFPRKRMPENPGQG